MNVFYLHHKYKADKIYSFIVNSKITKESFIVYETGNPKDVALSCAREAGHAVILL